MVSLNNGFVALYYIATVGLISGVVSGIGGGGGATLMIPAFIFTGLPPQMAVATAKMSGLGSDFGGLSDLFKSGQIRKDIVRVMIYIQFQALKQG